MSGYGDKSDEGREHAREMRKHLEALAKSDGFDYALYEIEKSKRTLRDQVFEDPEEYHMEDDDEAAKVWVEFDS